MQLSDLVSALVVLLGAVASLYLALVSGDYLLAVILGLSLPVFAFLLTLKTPGEDTHKKLMRIASIAGGVLVIGVALVVWLIEQSSFTYYLDKIELNNKKYSDRNQKGNYPPLPMAMPNGTPIYKDHLRAFQHNKPTVAFLAAPAGAGKSVLLQEMVGQSYKETQRGTVYLQLSEIKEKPNLPREAATYGTQVGLGKVSTLNTSDSDAAGLFTMICASQFRLGRLSEQTSKTWLLSRRTTEVNQRRFVEACRERLEEEANTPKGLRIFIDDVDEIEEDSLLQLITLIDREIQDASAKPPKNLLILIAGRPEVLYTSSRERRSLWDESRQRDAQFLLLTATIEKMPLDSPSFKDYLGSCTTFTLEDKDAGTRDKVVNALKLALQTSKNLRESIGYLEGCRFATSHFLYLNEKEPFNEAAFAKDFYNSWRDRAYEKHRIPSVEDSEDYDELLRSAALKLDQEGGEAKFHMGLRVLLYSGLIDLMPVRFGSREYRVRFQFPQFRDAVLNAPPKSSDTTAQSKPSKTR